MNFKKTGEITSKQFNEPFTNLTVVGSPTITPDGIYSSSHFGDYLTVNLFNTLLGKDNVEIYFEASINDATKKGYFLGSGNSANYGIINTYWNGTGQTDVRFYVNNTVQKASSVSTGTANGLYKFRYTLTSTTTQINITKPNNTVVSSSSERTNNDKFNEGNMFFRLGYLEGAKIDLKTLTIKTDNKVMYLPAINKCSVSSYQTTATDFIEI